MNRASAEREKPGGPRIPCIIGVLGGIASGKSLVARLLAGDAGLVIDADHLAREVLASPEVVSELRAAFGSRVFAPDGTLDREALADLVFGSRKERARLEGFTHPRIRDRIRAELTAALERGLSPIVLDVPLLLENEARHGLARECHELVFVDAPRDQREARALQRGWREGELARREAVQMPLDEKRSRSDQVIHNAGSLADLERAVREIRAAPPARRKPR